tara:strand:- start:1073 stop:1471 length:399 start_codon:yes stop_codon:yes gene_type:complete
MIQNITYKRQTIALIIKAGYEKKRGINFFTKRNFLQQVAFMYHPKGHTIKPHIHKKNTRTIKGTSEVLIILNGKIKIDFFTQKKKYIFSKIAKKHDIVILISGGHGFKMMNNCKFIEVKQGPYDSKKDKNKF